MIAVAVAAFEDELIDPAATVFRQWRQHLAALFEVGGMASGSAAQFAAVLLASTEGSVAMCRVDCDRGAVDEVAADLLDLVPTVPADKRGKKRS